jgi:large subunit ribosomal protein L14
MIFKGTQIRVVDNTGVKLVECIHCYKVSLKKGSYVGDVILTSVKKISVMKKIKKGLVFKGIMVRVNKKFSRNKNCNYIRCDENAVVLLNKTTLTPLGKRLKGFVFEELRRKNYSKVISLSGYVF